MTGAGATQSFDRSRIRPARAATPIVLLLALGLCGCAASAPRPVPGDVGAASPRVALLTFEDLSGNTAAADRLSRIFFAALGGTGTCRMVDVGEVEVAMQRMRIRTTSLLTADQVVELAKRLDARYLMAGTILEYGAVHTPDGEVPAVGVALRLLDGADGHVVWTGMRVRTGEDRESIFGWGRENSPDRLAEKTAADLFRDFRLPAEAGAPPSSGGTP